MAEAKIPEWPKLDLKLEAWGKITNYGFEARKSLGDWRSADLSPVVRAFLTNAIECCRLAAFPSGVFTFGRVEQLAEVAACMKLYGSPTHPQPTEGAIDPPPQEVIDLRTRYIFGREQCEPSLNLIRGVTVQTTFDVLPRALQWEYATLMASQIVTCWTVFETLAGDLWEVCLNIRPRLGYAALGTVPEGEEEDDDDEEGGDKKTRFPISLRQMERYEFNLKGRLGTLLKGKFNFTRKKGIAEAYRRVFGAREESELKAIFGARDLNALSAVRNVLAHRAGVVDEHFRSRVKRHPKLSSVPVDERFPIDGELCAELLRAGCDQGVKLIQFVDRWLAENPA